MIGDAIRKQYLKEAQKYLKCPRKMRKKILVELDDSLCTYIEAHPNATMKDLYAHFGSSAELAQVHLRTYDVDELHTHDHKFIQGVLVAVSIIVVLIITAAVIWKMADTRAEKASYSAGQVENTASTTMNTVITKKSNTRK